MEEISGKQLYIKFSELDKQLRSIIHSKGPLHKSTAPLRLRIRDQLERVLFADYDYAENKEVELTLWSVVFYKPLEELRRALRHQRSSERGSTPHPNQGSTTVLLFSQLLEEASSFYHSLIRKTQQAYNLLLPDNNTYNPAPLGRRQYLTIYRSLIFLGDLVRYKRDLPNCKTEWTASRDFYEQASRLFPEHGNPHNQLAVLAMYEDDQLEALYQYFRSLSVAVPFLTAKDNLSVVFEKNRLRVASLFPSRSLSLSKNLEEDLHSYFFILFVRVHGLLYTKTSLEVFTDLKKIVFKAVKSLMKRSELNHTKLLKLIVCNIFSIAHIKSLPSDQGQSGEQRTLLLNYALTFAMEFFSVVMSLFSDSSSTPPAIPSSSPVLNPQLVALLGPLAIFTDWLKLNSDLLQIYLDSSFTKEASSFRDRDGDRDAHSVWFNLARVVNQLPLVPNEEEERGALEEEVELRGFLPLEETSANHRDNKKLEPLSNTSSSSSSLSLSGLPPGDSLRASSQKLRRFALFITQHFKDKKIMFYHSDTKKFTAAGTNKRWNSTNGNSNTNYQHHYHSNHNLNQNHKYHNNYQQNFKKGQQSGQTFPRSPFKRQFNPKTNSHSHSQNPHSHSHLPRRDKKEEKTLPTFPPPESTPQEPPSQQGDPSSPETTPLLFSLTDPNPDYTLLQLPPHIQFQSPDHSDDDNDENHDEDNDQVDEDEDEDEDEIIVFKPLKSEDISEKPPPHLLLSLPDQPSLPPSSPVQYNEDSSGIKEKHTNFIAVESLLGCNGLNNHSSSSNETGSSEYSFAPQVIRPPVEESSSSSSASLSLPHSSCSHLPSPVSSAPFSRTESEEKNFLSPFALRETVFVPLSQTVSSSNPFLTPH